MTKNCENKESKKDCKKVSKCEEKSVKTTSKAEQKVNQNCSK